MTEVYKNSSQTVNLDINGATADTTPTATVYWGDSDTDELTVVSAVSGDSSVERWQTTVGFVQTTNEGEVKVVWDFAIDGSPVSKVDYIDVITPYVDLDDIRDELEVPDSITDDQLIRAERKARRIIDRYCSQTFGIKTESNYIRGNGTNFVNLPKRLVTVDTATRSDLDYPLTGYEVRNDGWTMKRVWDFAIDDDPWYTNPIRVPYVYPTTPEFQQNAEWIITGTWGYERVPANVRDSALLIIEQELCPQAVYRERFIKTMTFGDTKFEQDPQAWRGTGNAVADQLLSDYIRNGIAIL